MSMSHRACRSLARDIGKERSCRVLGRRYRSSEQYELNVVDKATGILFVVGSREEWVGRVKAAEEESIMNMWVCTNDRYSAGACEYASLEEFLADAKDLQEQLPDDWPMPVLTWQTDGDKEWYADETGEVVLEQVATPAGIV